MRPKQAFMAACFAAATPTICVPIASAQSRPDPADPAARVPAATYRSAFAGYRPLGEEKVGDWRAANDEVGRIGGWREYLREAQSAEGKPPAPGAPAQGAQGGHGHHHHGMPASKPMPGGKP